VCQSRADGLGLQLVVGDHSKFDYRQAFFKETVSRFTLTRACPAVTMSAVCSSSTRRRTVH
jgi:hypothetical protein